MTFPTIQTDEPMDQSRQMLLAGAYYDFVTSLTALRQVMGPAAGCAPS
jgi:hypothetical protein